MNEEVARYGYLILAAFLISSVVNYLYQVLMGVLLPKPDFGVLGVALSIFYIASVLTQNTFSWPATKFIAINPGKAARYFRTALVGNLSLAVAASLLILRFDSSPVMLLVAASLLLTAVVNSYVSAFRGFKKFGPVVVANVANPVVKLLTAVALVALGFGVFGAVVAVPVSIAFAAAYLASVAARIDFGNADGWSFRMAAESVPMSVIFLGISFLVNGSIVVLGYASSAVAGSFNAALTISRASFFVASALITVSFPYISSESFRERLSFESIKYVVLFVFPISISMASNPKAWLTVFFSKKYIEAAVFLRYLAAAMGFISLSTVLASNLVALGRYRFAAISITVASFAYALASFSASPVEIAEFLLIVSAALVVSLTAYYARNFYFKAGVLRMAKLLLCYAILFALSLPKFDGRLLSLAHIVASFAAYAALISIARLFDERDVEFLLSPLPERLRVGVAKIVVSLNSLLR